MKKSFLVFVLVLGLAFALGLGLPSVLSTDHSSGKSSRFGIRDRLSRWSTSLFGCSPVPVDDYLSRWATKSQEIIGQHAAIAEVTSALRLHSFSGSKPTVILLAGDNGVGKTKTATTLADSLYDECARKKAFLYIRGETFTKSPDAKMNYAFRDKIRKKIVDQLKHAPASLIVVDEVEKLDAATVSVFGEFFDASYPTLTVDDVTVELTKAIFVFISDFGHEGVAAGLSIDKIESNVLSDALSLWKDLKTVSLIKKVSVYVSATDDGVSAFVSHLIGHLPDDPRVQAYGNNVSLLMSEDMKSQFIQSINYRRKSPFFLYKNYRGVEELVEDTLIRHVLDALFNFDRYQTSGKPAALSVAIVPEYTENAREALNRHQLGQPVTRRIHHVKNDVFPFSIVVASVDRTPEKAEM